MTSDLLTLTPGLDQWLVTFEVRSQRSTYFDFFPKPRVLHIHGPHTHYFWLLTFYFMYPNKLTDFWPLKIKNIWPKTCDFWPFDSYPWSGPVTCDLWLFIEVRSQRSTYFSFLFKNPDAAHTWPLPKISGKILGWNYWKLEELAWAKLYKTVQSYVHVISCLTVQLTDNSMFNNLKR